MTPVQTALDRPLSVTTLLSEPATTTPGDLLAGLSARDARLPPFDDAVLSFCSDLSQTLFRNPECRAHPELQALAFWLRHAELVRLKAAFTSMECDDLALVPRGLVFHLPPSNVDTTFVYSWILSMLGGNANIVRLSDRAGEAARVVCRVLNDVLKRAAPRVQRSSAIVQYEHNDDVTAIFSGACDMRVIWGGDASVDRIRRIPIAPHAKELTFCDRYSLAAIRADAFLECDAAARHDLATRFFNDVFWFDQSACASPRLVIWVGDQDRCRTASQALYEGLAGVLTEKRYVLETATRLQKLTFAYRAILDRPVAGVQRFGSEIVVIELEHIRDLDRSHCGGGLLFEARAASLQEIGPALSRRDQTLAHFGFTRQDLRALVQHLNGAAVDRLIPLGRALVFNRYWDGYDLLREFVRTVHIQA
jgi:hypothetical protein